jgi:hypothetical protein
MIKKLLLVGVIGVAAFATLRGTKFFGLAKEEIKSATTWLDEQIPVEKEINRLRKEIAGLDKDRSKVADLLAKETVEVRFVREKTDELRASLSTEKDLLQAKATELRDIAGENPTSKVLYRGAKVSVAEAKGMLAADVARYGIKEGNLKNMEKALAMRERNKENLEKQFDVLKRQKEDLAIQVDRLEAEYNTLKLEQMESKYQTDSTRLAGIKESIRDIERRIAVQRERLNLEPRVQEVGTAGPTSDLTVDEIMAPLNGQKAESNGKVSKK